MVPTNDQDPPNAGTDSQWETDMDALSALRIEALNGQGPGHGMASPDQRRRRAHWLIDLVNALEAADLDAARVQFAGLIQSDPGLTHQPLLHRIGNALQSSNTKLAQQLAHELRDEGLAVWNDLVHGQAHPPASPPTGIPTRTSESTASLPLPVRAHRASNGQHIVDYRA